MCVRLPFLLCPTHASPFSASNPPFAGPDSRLPFSLGSLTPLLSLGPTHASPFSASNASLFAGPDSRLPFSLGLTPLLSLGPTHASPSLWEASPLSFCTNPLGKSTGTGVPMRSRVWVPHRCGSGSALGHPCQNPHPWAWVQPPVRGCLLHNIVLMSRTS